MKLRSTLSYSQSKHLSINWDRNQNFIKICRKKIRGSTPDWTPKKKFRECLHKEYQKFNR